MRFAYADPPYIGQAKRHYSADPRCAEVDHAELVARLVADFPDGWALSLSSTSLKQVLSYCPDGVRVMAWVKPFASWKPGPRVFYAWEPVILSGGRPWKRGEWRTRDWIAVMPPVFVKQNRTDVHGQKPMGFCFWIFEAFGMHADDTLQDLFPGSGNVTYALDSWRRQRRLA